MNKLDRAMQIIDAVTEKMQQNREDELIAKLENNDLYRSKERDMDITPESGNPFCVDKPVRDIDLL